MASPLLLLLFIGWASASTFPPKVVKHQTRVAAPVGGPTSVQRVQGEPVQLPTQFNQLPARVQSLPVPPIAQRPTQRFRSDHIGSQRTVSAQARVVRQQLPTTAAQPTVLPERITHRGMMSLSQFIHYLRSHGIYQLPLGFQRAFMGTVSYSVNPRPIILRRYVGSGGVIAGSNLLTGPGFPAGAVGPAVGGLSVGGAVGLSGGGPGTGPIGPLGPGAGPISPAGPGAGPIGPPGPGAGLIGPAGPGTGPIGPRGPVVGIRGGVRTGKIESDFPVNDFPGLDFGVQQNVFEGPSDAQFNPFTISGGSSGSVGLPGIPVAPGVLGATGSSGVSGVLGISEFSEGLGTPGIAGYPEVPAVPGALSGNALSTFGSGTILPGGFQVGTGLSDLQGIQSRELGLAFQGSGSPFSPSAVSAGSFGLGQQGIGGLQQDPAIALSNQVAQLQQAQSGAIANPQFSGAISPQLLPGALSGAKIDAPY